MLPSWADETVFVARPRVVDDHGAQVVDYGDLAPDRPVEGCQVTPGASDVDLANRASSLVQWTVLAPAGTDVVGTDAVRYRGVLYRVDGEPLVWPSATGNLDHVVVLLKAWKEGP